MNDLREKLVNYIWDELCFDEAGSLQSEGVDEAADAIIAALPGMVQPLVWSAWGNGYCVQTWNRLAFLSEAKTNNGTYRIGRKHSYVRSTDKNLRAFDSEYSSEWYVDAPYCGKLLGPFNGDVAAKAAAQQHYITDTLARLGLTPPPPHDTHTP